MPIVYMEEAGKVEILYSSRDTSRIFADTRRLLQNALPTGLAQMYP